MQNEIKQVLVTGATGFVGKALCEHLLNRGFIVKAVGRKAKFSFTHSRLHYFSVQSIDEATNWQAIMPGVEVVVHLAARVHQMKEKGLKKLALYQKTNVLGTQQLAKAAIHHEVKRFIYMSTVKVLAEKTIETPLRAEDQPRPKEAYSLSKLQGEQILCQESKRSGMEWVIIRPPLIYGKGVMGNFKKLLKLAQSRFPLPFATIKNKRSLVSIQNLISLIECCLSHPNARSEVFLVSDNEDLSTGQLIKNFATRSGEGDGYFLFLSHS
jgi:nucleoside-diphosphate-sugar epimerase